MQSLAIKNSDKTLNRMNTKLRLIHNLLDVLHKQEISYCHWKSNEHLGASMAGDTDLDILFSENQKESTVSHLQSLGFKKFNSIKEKQYHDIEDFIGLDIVSGKVVHVHAHFRLTMGEVYLKGYQLNFEEKILSSRIFNEEFGIYTSSPAFELILLYFREALKLRTRELLKLQLFNRNEYGGNVMVEYHWLQARTTNKEIKAILQVLFQDYKPIYELVTGEFNRRELYKLSILIKEAFKPNRLYSPSEARFNRWYRETTVLISPKLARLLNRPILSQRINPNGGIIIAVVGADGSGKSTVIGNLEQTFKTKLDVFRIYFGRGDGRISWPRKLLNLAKNAVFSEKKKPAGTETKTSKPTRKEGLLADTFRCMEAMIVAHEKRRNLARMLTAKKKGMLVICDRFPQNQIMGYNDGPLLHYLKDSKNPVFRALAKMEANVYAEAENNPPDTLFKLIADAAIVEARKPGETPMEMLKTKIAGIKQLDFSEKCKVVTVDASQPLDQVLATVKQGVWDTYL
jgi:hypothetical protein